VRLFRSEPPAETPPPTVVDDIKTPAAKPPIIEDWSEKELVAVYNAAPVKHLKRGDAVFADIPKSDSFFVLVEGVIHVIVKLNGHPGRPGAFKRGDCISPLPSSSGLMYCAEAATDCTIIEISPAILKHLSEKTQLCIYRVAMTSTAKINAYIRSVNGEINLKILRLSQYIQHEDAARATAIQSEFVKGFLQSMPRMPAYATGLAGKLLDEGASVQEVVEGLKGDPNLVGIVLKTVNSAQYAFTKKIENFYNACMILGFNNIYSLLMREATQSTMPVTPETTQILRHSCLISVLSFELALMAKLQNAQTVATIGLLHDLGKGIQVVMKNAHRDKADLIDLLDPAKLGAALLRVWSLPEKICRSVELQQYPEFIPPDLTGPEYRSDAAAVHIAHVLEGLLTNKPLDPSKGAYTADYMALLGFGDLTPAQLLNERVLPVLKKNPTRVPPEVRSILLK